MDRDKQRKRTYFNNNKKNINLNQVQKLKNS